MEPSAPVTLEDIVDTARRLPDAEREAWLVGACGGDERLARELLDWLGNPIESQGPPASRLPRERIGPWRLLRSLGRGGMGEVFLAERADQHFRQRVAIKLVAPGRVSPSVLGRLRTERQILATLEHPNIARLLDGGALPDGTPYIVMEYVDGEPIDVYCDRLRLDLDARIDLFRTVCTAVHRAHQNLIVHRDLKPSNILVTSDGVPKLLDFGIAKLLDTRQAMHTLAVTHADFRMLTPDHASPEQVRGQPITTASDVYVLGVLLHELLTGSRPFDIEIVTFSEIERAICERPAVAPSVKLAQLTADDPTRAEQVAACRATTPLRLRKRLEGDLDNIVGLAMRKEPQRRYGSAEQLSEDLRRYRTGEPVIARRDTRTYRLRKFVGRHRYGVAAGASIVLLLVTFAIAMAIQAGRIANERDIATAERTRAEQVSSFLVELFELSDPMEPDSPEVTAQQLLDVGARRITEGLADQPQTRALLLSTIGRVYGNLGDQDRAIALLEEASELAGQLYGDRDARVAEALRTLGESLTAAGAYDQAQRRLDAALHAAASSDGPRSLLTAGVRHSLGRLEQQRGDLAAAEQHYRLAAEIHAGFDRQDNAAHSSLLNDLAGVLTHRAAYDEAASLYRAAIEIDRELLGEEQPQLAQHLQSLAVVLQLQGRFDEAAPLHEQSVALLTQLLGDTHPQTVDALGNYGRFLQARGELAEAEATLRMTLARNLQIRGAAHPYVGYDHVSLGMLLHERGRLSEAEEHFRTALAIYADTLPADHLYIGSARVGLGRTLTSLGRLPEARAELEQALAIWTKGVAPDHPQRLAAAEALAAAQAPAN